MERLEHYTDLDIAKRVLCGELALFEILIRRNNAYLYKTGRAYNYSHEDTQDLMQDTFVDAYCNLSSFENRSSFKTWIIRIMMNNCFRRKQKFSVKYEEVRETNDHLIPMFISKNSSDTDHAVLNRELGAIVENALMHIPLDYRMVFSLREINGLSLEETADVLTISQSNVKVRLNRGKAMLRKEIEKFYKAEEIFEFNLVYCDAMVAEVMNKLSGMSGQSESPSGT